MLAATKLGDDLVATRIAYQVEAPNALQCHYPTLAHRLSRCQQGFVVPGSGVTLGVAQFQPWTTCRAGNRLRVVASVFRIFVFDAAGFTHPEPGHRRIQSVVRQRRDNGKPRTAIGAVNKRVAITPIGRIVHFAQTILADREIGQH